MGKYFDEWVVGEEYVSPGRTITESDVVMFAATTGDYNQVHTNAELMKDSIFGQRIAHGLLGLAVSHGLWTRSGDIEGNVIAFLGVDEWKFLGPIFFGDTIRTKVRVVATKASSSKPDRGVVKCFLELINQDDKVVQSGYQTLMFKRKPV